MGDLPASSPQVRPDLRIFISSPGDVEDERAFAQRLIERELAKKPHIRDCLNLRAFRYDDPDRQIPLVANLSPQDAVNRGMPLPSACDIVVAFLWTRMGTELAEPRKPDGSAYLSGTEWEIEDALRDGSSATVLVYHRQDQPLTPAEDEAVLALMEQRTRVRAFVERLRTAGRGVENYTGLEEFRTRLTQHLEELIQQRLDALNAGSALRKRLSPPTRASRTSDCRPTSPSRRRSSSAAMAKSRSWSGGSRTPTRRSASLR